jgi:hypothetical protein
MKRLLLVLLILASETACYMPCLPTGHNGQFVCPVSYTTPK